MLFSTKAEYGVRLMVELGRQEDGAPVALSAVALSGIALVNVLLPVIVKELLDAGLLDGDCLTCTGETLAGQVAQLAPPAPDGEVIGGGDSGDAGAADHDLGGGGAHVVVLSPPPSDRTGAWP